VTAVPSGADSAALGAWYERDVLWTPTVAGGRVLLHLPTGTYLGLDRAATRIVELLEQQGDVDGAASALALQFDLPLERARVDVLSVLDAIRQLSATRHSRGRTPTVAGGLTELRRWYRLPGRRRWMAARAAVVVILVEVGLRRLELDRLARWAGVPLASGPLLASDPSAGRPQVLDAREQLAAWAVGWVLARWIHDATCLRQALAFGWFIRRRHPQLRIGLLEGDDMVAHAWVEAEGLVYNALPVTGSFVTGAFTPGPVPLATTASGAPEA
jgi:hypothetical protein